MRANKKGPKSNDGKPKSGGRRTSGGSKPIHKKKQKFNAYKDKLERQKKGDPVPSMSEDIRLNKYLSNAGICSRREADVLIQTGVVKVNDEVVTELGYKVKPSDKVQYDGETISPDTKRYFLLNKPKGYSVTNSIREKNVMHLIAKACKEDIYPIDRMDKNTTGLLLFTNDTDLMKKMGHPKYELTQIFQVSITKPMTVEHLQHLRTGVELEDGKVWADAAEFVENDPREIGVEIHSNKRKGVQRMIEALGYEIKKIDRVAYAGLTKKDLPRSYYRALTEKEISFLRMSKKLK